MSFAPMSRKTKRAYLRLCPEKRRKKKNLVHKGFKKNELLQPSNNSCTNFFIYKYYLNICEVEKLIWTLLNYEKMTYID